VALRLALTDDLPLTPRSLGTTLIGALAVGLNAEAGP
jgi:hypothetical protein